MHDQYRRARAGPGQAHERRQPVRHRLQRRHRGRPIPAGDLTVDADRLQSALSADPAGVQKLVRSWANSLATLVNAHAGPGGTIEQRVSSDDGQPSQLARRISSMQAALADKRALLTRQFAHLESALSSNESRSSWLAGQIAALPGSRRSSS
ncbi:MAG TPA: flagellar filament capping protein FliD [Solirubrobacteraceae bacterium]|jgi:flagellar hook-associated protein 2|nr:flagellar filament capping protein FliD [Solirubrobacteraceae bacterium]